MNDSIPRLYFGDSGPDPLRPATTQADGSGWLPGPPERITEGILEIDLDAYRRLECSCCGRQAMTLRPEHRGERYRLIATCRCGQQVTL